MGKCILNVSTQGFVWEFYKGKDNAESGDMGE